MMRIISLLLLFQLAVICYSQSDTLHQAIENEVSFIIVEKVPKVKGGMKSFRKWIEKNNELMNSSDSLTSNDKVYVSFTVDVTGNLNDITIIRGLGPPYDSEAKRLVSECPRKWKPAIQKGKSIPVKMTIPVGFVSNTDR
jgi:Ca-activated chloride channel family protein